MVRKPKDWESVDNEFITLPHQPHIYTALQLGIEENLLAPFKIPVQQKFLVIRGDKEYAVNTEGYNYTRYIQRIR